MGFRCITPRYVLPRTNHKTQTKLWHPPRNNLDWPQRRGPKRFIIIVNKDSNSIPHKSHLSQLIRQVLKKNENFFVIFLWACLPTCRHTAPALNFCCTTASLLNNFSYWIRCRLCAASEPKLGIFIFLFISIGI